MNIFEAVREGKEEIVSSLTSADPTLLEKAEEGGGDTPLLVAVEHGKADMVTLLLQQGANIDRAGPKGETALMRAITKGNEECSSLLLGHGAREDLADDAGKTPLMRASIQGHLGLVRLVFEAMLERGKAKMGVDRRGKDGKTALHHAAAGGHFDITAYLLCNEAQASIKDAFGMTPLMLACEKGPVEVVQILLLLGVKEGQGLDERDEKGKTALHHAARRGNKRVVGLLLKKGAKASKKDKKSKTPLMLACSKGHLEVVEMLVEARKGRGLEAMNHDGMTALHYAAYKGHKDIVTFLLSKGAQANASDEHGFTAFMCACLHGHLDVVQILHSATEGQGLEETDSCGQRALDHAARGGKMKVVAFLLRKGAQANTKDNDGATPFMFACRSGVLEVVHRLLEATEGQGLEDRDNNGETALHLAATGEVVAFLLNKGLDASTKNAMQETPLMSACRRGNVGVVKFLLKHTGGQGLSERNREGKTALHLAASGWESRRYDMINVLLLAGAEPSTTDNQGRTPPQAAEAGYRNSGYWKTFEVSYSVPQDAVTLIAQVYHVAFE
jgi:ankyrin repeat protein